MNKLISMLILIALFPLSNTTTHAQAPEFVWAVRAGSGEFDFGRGIAMDDLGNIFVTGDFRGTVLFGDTTLTSAGTLDMFIAKYNVDGNFLWVNQAGATGGALGYGVVTDGSGNIIVAGDFWGMANFGGDTTLTTAGGIFIAKYDGDGNLLWVEQAGGSVLWSGIAIDGSGNSIVTGSFIETATFGDTTLTSAGRDMFIIKYDGDGTFLWVESAGVRNITEAVYGFSVAMDALGNIIVTGSLLGTATFFGGDITLTSAGSFDIFIAKYDGNGNFLWVKQAGGTLHDTGWGITTDGSGNIIVTGHFTGTATFGNTTLSGGGSENIFIAKYDGDGNFLWAKQAGGGNGDRRGRGIVTEGLGNIIVTGNFRGTATFGNTILSSAGSDDIFVAKYDGDGNFLWVKQAGGSGFERGREIATDGSGNIVLTGDFGGTATFGDTTLTSAGSQDIFIAKLDLVTGIEEEFVLPKSFNLSQSYPNPFNPSTTIEFSVPVNSNVRLTIYNLLGQVVTTLVNEEISAGNYSVIWNGTNKNGFQVSSGVYLYKMKASGNNGNSYSETKKMVLLK